MSLFIVSHESEEASLVGKHLRVIYRVQHCAWLINQDTAISRDSYFSFSIFGFFFNTDRTGNEPSFNVL